MTTTNRFRLITFGSTLAIVTLVLSFVASQHSTRGILLAEDSPTRETDGWKEWPEPETVLVFTGEQHGYIEPCGCTGLENQKGGLARRHTLLKQISDKGWNPVPFDVGNQVRRYGRQSEIKFEKTVSSLKTMEYQGVGLGPDDVRLDVGVLLSKAASEPTEDVLAQFLSANVTLLDPSLMPTHKVVESGSKKIGITSVLDPATAGKNLSQDITIAPMVPSLEKVSKELASRDCDFTVLMFYGGNDAEKTVADLARRVPGFDLIVIANEFGEPIYQPQRIEDTSSFYILTGHKGMYACLIGLYKDTRRYRYARVPLSDRFEDSKQMLTSLSDYQKYLETLGLEGLDVREIAHPSGNKYVGSETCGECHTTAFDIWKDSPHVHATESIVRPPNDRGAIARHFDPECISCHVTGWNAQDFYPYTSGYMDLETSKHLTGSGCENCHGPGSQHVAAENGDIDADDELLTKLRRSMILPYKKAKERCIDCHDIDNSPGFHEDGAFEEYWERVKHVGKD